MEGGVLRLLGLDVGERRIGVSVSDPTGTITSPLTAIQRAGLEDDIKAITDLAEKHEAEAIVVGLPISLSGRMGPQARRIQEFIKALSQKSPRASSQPGRAVLHGRGGAPPPGGRTRPVAR